MEYNKRSLKEKTNIFTINQIRDYSGNLITNNVEICNIFNKYFSNVGPTIENNFKSSGLNFKSFEYLNNKCNISDSIYINPMNNIEIENLLKSIKDNTSFYESGLSNYILLQVAQSISYPLSYLFNLAISLGTFPNNFKKCVILPLYKAADSKNISNYRPIALSLTISKIFKKCIKYRILQFLNKNNFFSKNQFGFLKGKSTNDGLFLLNQFIHDKLDND